MRTGDARSFEIGDDAAGPAVSLTREPEPRLVEDPVFQIATWDAGSLGDPHDRPTRAAFMAAMSPERAAIFGVARVDTPRGPHMISAAREGGRIAGRASATLQRLCPTTGMEEITRAGAVEGAEYLIPGEPVTHEDFVGGGVFRYEVHDRWGRVPETKRDLHGEDHACHPAQGALDRHLVGVGWDGPGRPGGRTAQEATRSGARIATVRSFENPGLRIVRLVLRRTPASTEQFRRARVSRDPGGRDGAAAGMPPATMPAERVFRCRRRELMIVRDCNSGENIGAIS